MKKTSLFCVAAAIAAVPFFLYAESVPYAGQTEAGEYEISTFEQLTNFTAVVRNYNYAGSTIALASDIDCGGDRFISGNPINATTFSGTFDGNGHRIFNFVNTVTNSNVATPIGYGVAMFDAVKQGAVIKNLTLDGISHAIDYGSCNYAAAFVAYARGANAVTFENCHFTGAVTNGSNAAVFVGNAYRYSDDAPDAVVVTMSNCTANATVSAQNANSISLVKPKAGGLVASVAGVVATDCAFSGSVEGSWSLGGLAGHADDSSFTRCTFDGTATGGPGANAFKDGGCGGLVGQASNTVFSACSANVDIDWDYATGLEGRRSAETNFVAVGGAAGVTIGDSAFYDCSVIGKVRSAHGYVAGFVGWTAGSETFSNCTTSARLDQRGTDLDIAVGGFAASVASSDAKFIDCRAKAGSGYVLSGFFDVQHECLFAGPVGSNTFQRCSVAVPVAYRAGFAQEATNATFIGCTVTNRLAVQAGFACKASDCTFTDCQVQVGETSCGFVAFASGGNTFDGCSVVDANVSVGFVDSANYDKCPGYTNVFRRCRVNAVYDTRRASVDYLCGFARELNDGSVVEDCVACGGGLPGADDVCGFANVIDTGSVVRRCVGAVMPPFTAKKGAAFAGSIAHGTTVEDCYAVYGSPFAGSVDGGAVTSRCFTVDEIQDETFTGYDFENVWRAPASAPGFGEASSPYLAASTDTATNFWTKTAVVSGVGEIRVDGERREAYPAGTVLTVRANQTTGGRFVRWVGEGFADPTSPNTTYTVRNVSVISAIFAENYSGQTIPGGYTISSFSQLTNLMNVARTYDYAGSTFFLAASINCGGDRFITGDPVNGTTFRGVFDGGGHRIFNFVHTAADAGDSTSAGYGVAMFDKVKDGAVIRDLKLEGIVVGDDGGECPCAAVFAAFAEGENAVTLENCRFTGAITNCGSSAVFVGSARRNPGDAPDAAVVTMSNCTATASVCTTTNAPAGGLVAVGQGVVAMDCSFTGDVSGEWTLGGLAGQMEDSAFLRCSFTGKASGGPGKRYAVRDGGCGGLVGFASNTVFRACSVDADIDWEYNTGRSKRTTADNNFVAVGGAAGVTLGESEFGDCSVVGSVKSAYGYVAGFVGWTAGAETFSNCTTTAAINKYVENNGIAIGGFAASVASSEAKFVDCYVKAATGSDVQSGFYDVQHECLSAGPVGTNSFLRCAVDRMYVKSSGFANEVTNGTFTCCAVTNTHARQDGFAHSAFNGTFTGCSVNGGQAPVGFIDNAYGGNTFEDCSVADADVSVGFVNCMNRGNYAGRTNVFHRCRVGATFRDLGEGLICGFAWKSYPGTIIEDCAAYGAGRAGIGELYGFIGTVEGGTAIRRSVGAVLPPLAVTKVAGFAGSVKSSVLEDCYSVYGSPFVLSEGGKITRCFAVGEIQDDTFPGYDFDNVWHAPDGVASSPYLSASTDPSTNFWAESVVVSGNGYIYGSPVNFNLWRSIASSYPTGTVIRVRADPNAGYRFVRWLGDGYADPTAQETTYAVSNVSVIAAMFSEEFYGQTWPGVYTVSSFSQLTNFMATARSFDFADSKIILEKDIDCGGERFVSGDSVNGTTFKGVFDGEGHRIFNFVNTAVDGGDSASAGYGVAMFDNAADGAVIKDVTLEGVVHDDSGMCPSAAAFVACARGANAVTFENCRFSGAITNCGSSAVFVGYACRNPEDAPDAAVVTMSNCTANASVCTATNAPAGGFVAVGEGVVATDCSFAGDVYGEWTLGGLAGSASDSSFTRCTFDGTAFGGPGGKHGGHDGGCGGLVGFASNTVFRACSVEADIDWDYATTSSNRMHAETNFVAVGGVAGVTLGASAFHDCSFTGTVQSVHGYVAGFVGWTAGSETFSNCTAIASINPYSTVTRYAIGGFAASVASSDAKFIDCYARAEGKGIQSGFYDIQVECLAVGRPVGTNEFIRCTVDGMDVQYAGFARDVTNGVFTCCSVTNTSAGRAGFAVGAFNGTFTGCSVRGGSAPSGFVTYAYGGNMFEDCSVIGTEVSVGFVSYMNQGNYSGRTNVFRRCRVGAAFIGSSDGTVYGFAERSYIGTTFEDCAAYGAGLAGCEELYGFIGLVIGDTSVRRCVGAVLPPKSVTKVAGFVGSVNGADSVFEDCYAVYGSPFAFSAASAAVMSRCFTVDEIQDETFPGYDFENVWRTPASAPGFGAASSPYLAASTDDATNFWAIAAVATGRGRVLVKDGDEYVEPAEAYPAGTVLTVRAAPDEGYLFVGWSGEGFADPAAQETTYTVRNIGAITAMFSDPYAGQTWPGTYTISTLSELTNFLAVARGYDYAGSTFVLVDDIDCEGDRFVPGDPSKGAVFSGMFDGNGRRIFNFVNSVADNIGSVPPGYGLAMFDTLRNGAVVKNLTLDGIVVPGHFNPQYVAAFAAYARGANAVTFENCHFTGAVTNKRNAAVFVGNAYRIHSDAPDAVVVTMSNCTANATVSAQNGENFYHDYSKAGGLVANVEGVAATDCAFTGRVEGCWSLGGLAGRADCSSFTRCTFNGDVVGGPGESAFANGGCGGLAGEASNTVFRACSVEADIDWDYVTGSMGRRDADNNFVAVGGAAGVTLGASAFHDCSFTGSVQSAHGYVAGFVGWTAGSETFSNCTAVASVNPLATEQKIAIGGFAGSVASSEARFIDCSATAAGTGLQSGFYDVQHECLAIGPIGTNTFLRCQVVGSSVESAGFVQEATNAVFSCCSVADTTSGNAGFVLGSVDAAFTDCEVRGGAAKYGFVASAYSGNTFEGCSVVGTEVAVGFVNYANAHNVSGSTNEFRNCRAGCVFRIGESAAMYYGFGWMLNRGTVVEDCVAYGAVPSKVDDVYGFAYRVDAGASIRRSVGAVYPSLSATKGAGFAGYLLDGATVEDCYSVYGPLVAATDGDSENGAQGGFVKSCKTAVARCFALWPVPDASSEFAGCGSFCGVTNEAQCTSSFADCYRPAESAVGSVNNAEDDGIAAVSAAEFASATFETFTNYDFEAVWRAPASAPGFGAASSPYLAASTDSATNFWTLTAVVSGEGRILVKDGDEYVDPAEAYPAGIVLTIRAVSDEGYLFTGWIGDGVADPMSVETTYTVKNVGAVLARFDVPPYKGQTKKGSYCITSSDQLTNLVATARGYDYAESTFILANDIDCDGESLVSADPEHPSMFSGTFDGDGHAIRDYGAALFDVVTNGAVFCNITFEGVIHDDSFDCPYSAAFATCAQGANAVTFENCHFAGAITNGCGAAAFLGKACRNEDDALDAVVATFTNCTANASVHSPDDGLAGGFVADGTGVFAVDCSFTGDVSADASGGFVGRSADSTFLNCTVEDATVRIAGFVNSATNVTFSACTVRGVETYNGFAMNAFGGNVFEDCVVIDTVARIGFVNDSNPDNVQGLTNEFRRCRAGCMFDARNTTAACSGFAGNLRDGSVVEDCAAYGAGLRSMRALYGFVGDMYPGAVVRRSVAAVMPYETVMYGAGFAGTVRCGAKLADCYTVYGPRAAATVGDSFLGVQGGFVRRLVLDQADYDRVFVRCHALGLIPDASAGLEGCGSFCGIISGEETHAAFSGCSARKGSAVGLVNGEEHNGVYSMPADYLSGATGVGWKGFFDWENAWYEPKGDVSCPYLAASTDASTNFWTFAAVVRGCGRILVRDGDEYVEPAKAYPVGTVLTVRAIPDEGYLFKKWVCEGFADPAADETTYVVSNVSVIAAMFTEPYTGQTVPGDYTVSTFEQLTNFTAKARTCDYAGSSFTLYNDIDCEGGSFVAGDVQSPAVFSGVFDGAGFRIRNFTNEVSGVASGDDPLYGAALFDIVRGGAVVKDLALEGAVSGGDSDGCLYAAAFASYAHGAGAVTFENCHFTGTVSNQNSSAVFVGRAERDALDGPDVTVVTLANCTADATVFTANDVPSGGFVASGEGVSATDCAFTGSVSGGKSGGFAGDVAESSFSGCSVEDVTVGMAGFVHESANGAFTNCYVQGVSALCGFVTTAVTGNVFEACCAIDARATVGFVQSANLGDDEGGNVFRSCRVKCLLDNPDSEDGCCGFARYLKGGTVVEDCVAYGAAIPHIAKLYGFAESVTGDAVVRRSVGAVLPHVSTSTAPGFVGTIDHGAAVEDCYSVYGQQVPSGRYAYSFGSRGGFVDSCAVGSSADDFPLARCFTLWPFPALPENCAIPETQGSFCGDAPAERLGTSFVDCYRPAESEVGSVNNADDDGVAAVSAAEFASATAETFTNYDFEVVWREPASAPGFGAASSPYLAASTDAETNFWTSAYVVSGYGRILVKDGDEYVEPAEAYPAGTVLTVCAVPDEDNIFLCWSGEGFADPLAQETTYTVRNIGAIAVSFRTPYAGQVRVGDYTLSRPDQLRLFSEKMREYGFAHSTFTLYKDIDCEGGQFTFFNARNQAPARFSGTLDGAGFTIGNFANVVPGRECTNGVALIDVASNGAVIRNITLEGRVDGYVQTGYDCAYAAAFVASAQGANAITFENCHFSGAITNYRSAAVFVGNAVRNADDAPDAIVATLTNCTANASVKSYHRKYNSAGVSGVVSPVGGFVAAGEGVLAMDCSYTGDVQGYWSAGGMVGEAVDSAFAHCAFTGMVYGGQSYSSVTNIGSGGIVGFASNVVARACSSQGEVHFTVSDNFTAGGGVAGVTLGESAFYDCSFDGMANAGFVGWTAGSETFSNCTVAVTNAIGGFARNVASSEAEFMDCFVTTRGKGIGSGFFDGQAMCLSAGPVGTNRFTRCTVADTVVADAGFARCSLHSVFADCVVTNVSSRFAGFAKDVADGSFANCRVVDSTADIAGFVMDVTDGSFTNCCVVDSTADIAGFVHVASNGVFASCAFIGGTSSAGFVEEARDGNVFEDCYVDAEVSNVGFVRSANPAGEAEAVNEFRRCSARCVYRNMSGGACHGFAESLGVGTLVEDCVAYGAAPFDRGTIYGFAGTIGTGAAVRRSVGAVMPPMSVVQGAGFADAISAGATVEDSYSLYGPRISADRANASGVQGGFARSSGGALARCFTLWPIADSSRAYAGNGSFCGVATGEDASFAGCYRPAESAVGAVDNAPVAGVDALGAAEFSAATGATLAGYDFENVWHAPGGVASSPYLAAAMDGAGNFRTFSFVASGEGSIRVNDGGDYVAPAASYAPGTVITVRAEPGEGYAFSRWIGEGFADPAAQETTYTVRNIGTIAAVFGKTISSRAEFEAIPDGATGDYLLVDDLDFSDGGRIAPRRNFRGRFIGNGNAISGVSWTGGAAGATNALFASISNGAEIRDLTVEATAGNGSESVAGLVTSVGHASLVSNCHARVAFRGSAASCNCYGLAANASGSDVRIIDCTADGEMVNGGETVGFLGSANLFSGEIARCASFCRLYDASARAVGFAKDIVLDAASVVRECFAAGFADSHGDASGFANAISFRDTVSALRDCYSAVDVKAGLSFSAGIASPLSSGRGYGIAKSIAGYDSDSPNVVSNVWFGGAVSGGYSNYVFSATAEDVVLAACAYIAAPLGGSQSSAAAFSVSGNPAVAIDGVAEIPFASRLLRSSWPGCDFGGVWSMVEGSTTPYFAWSLSNGGFRLFPAHHPSTEITLPESASPGASAAVHATTTDEFFFHEWLDSCEHSGTTASLSASDTTILADNHRAVRAVWGKSILTVGDLQSINSNIAGLYGLVRDVDCGNATHVPVPFNGLFCGHGYTISNMRIVQGSRENVGLFSGLVGATITDLALADVSVTGKTAVGALAGSIKEGTKVENVRLGGVSVSAQSRAGAFAGFVTEGATVRYCSVVGATVAAGGISSNAGGFVGQVGEASVSRCYAMGDVKGANYIGGFAGLMSSGAGVNECFACGTATGTNNYGSTTGKYVGGFVGQIAAGVAVSDCYTLAPAKGYQYVGGFAGQVSGPGTTVTRCYMAGSAFGANNDFSFDTYSINYSNIYGKDIGGFVGAYSGDPVFTDCLFCCDEVTSVTYAGAGLVEIPGVVSLEEEGMREKSNFAAYHETGIWTQAEDGTTQPYFAWSLENGKMLLYCGKPDVAGASVTGSGRHSPGTGAAIGVTDGDDRIFLAWTGNATFADADAYATTVHMDNFRYVNARFGTAIRNAEELRGIASDRSGVYGLAADIDLSEGNWTPLCSTDSPFVGSLYGRGHKITGLTIANFNTAISGPDECLGLFRCVKNATLNGIVLENVSVGGYRRIGALAGEVRGETAIRNCFVSGTVTATNTVSGLLVGRVFGYGTTFANCSVTGRVVGVSTSADRMGGFIGSVENFPVAFLDCTSKAEVLCDSDGGGFIGFIGADNSSGSSTAKAAFGRCSAEGDVTTLPSSTSYVGGFVGHVYSPSRFRACVARGTVSASREAGGFAGMLHYDFIKFSDCTAEGDVIVMDIPDGNFYSEIGGFAGCIWSTGKSNEFVRCTAKGDVCGDKASQVGGFAGAADAHYSRFTDCDALGLVVGQSRTGGFVGNSDATAVRFTRCRALKDVTLGVASNSSNPGGGFIGYANGARSIFSDCVAYGNVVGYSEIGGFVGKSGKTGIRYEHCRAFGNASAPNMYVGGFVGFVSSSNDYRRCMATGAARGTQYIGGFSGRFYGAGSCVSECIALGDATATTTGYDACAGGFAGRADSSMSFSDSYSLGNARGLRVVGGFAGYANGSGTLISRCYSAGVANSAGTYVGGFIGNLASVGSMSDCAMLRSVGGIAATNALGTSTAMVSGASEYVAVLDDVAFRSRANFAAYHAVLEEDGNPVWAQTDGVTQPYLVWCAADGGLFVFATVGGSASATISGTGAYAPGDEVEIKAMVEEDGFLARWTGSAPYADPTNATTTIVLDNHRVVSAKIGRYIRTADELQALTNNLSGVFGLANDIDLSGRDWTPIGNYSSKFMGELYGFGHEITGLVCTNRPSASYRGLFGCVNNAILDGIAVSGTVAGNQYVGGLAGSVENGTTIRDCSASVAVRSSDSYAGGLVGACENGNVAVTISGCRADGFVSGGGACIGGLLGTVRMPALCTNSVARGDVRTASGDCGGFIGDLRHASATISDCWCSGAIWGSSHTALGLFVGEFKSGKIVNCRACPYASGPRPFGGSLDSSVTLSEGWLTLAEVEALSSGWPKVVGRDTAATPIRSAKELKSITNNLAGCYVLVADIDLRGAAWNPIKDFSGEFYGHNHAISNFTVNATTAGAGLFGSITRGRVCGVRAYGSVSSTAASVGGFAGIVQNGSLVDGCSFEGCVTNSASSSYTGGFAGYVQGKSVIVRSVSAADVCAGDRTGGFVGIFTDGYMSDDYALSDVDARGARAGGFVGYAGDSSSWNALASISKCWCSGNVTSTTYYAGAFIGDMYSSRLAITNSYYDAGATAQKAQGESSVGRSKDCAGITPVASAAMLHQASFDALDFTDTWGIDEGESMPYLLTFLVQYDDEGLSGYELWLDENGIDIDIGPNEIGNGIPYGFRYVFDIPVEKGPDDLDEPLFYLTFDAGGKPCVKLPNQKEAKEDVTVEVLASTDLADFAKEDPSEWTSRVVMGYDAENGVWRPADYFTDDDYVYPPSMFFRWRLMFNQ